MTKEIKQEVVNVVELYMALFSESYHQAQQQNFSPALAERFAMAVLRNFMQPRQSQENNSADLSALVARMSPGGRA